MEKMLCLGLFDLITHVGLIINNNEKIRVIQEKTNISLDSLGVMMGTTCSTTDSDLTKMDLLDSQSCNRFIFSRVSSQIDEAKRNFISAVSLFIINEFI